MKSLEIEAIDYIISWIENVGVTYDMEVSCYEEEFKKIKQDLEVLKIIKKKRVDVGYILALINQYTDNLYVLEKYNGTLSIPYQLTMKELLKVKQWLEEQE